MGWTPKKRGHKTFKELTALSTYDQIRHLCYWLEDNNDWEKPKHTFIYDTEERIYAQLLVHLKKNNKVEELVNGKNFVPLVTSCTWWIEYIQIAPLRIGENALTNWSELSSQSKLNRLVDFCIRNRCVNPMDSKKKFDEIDRHMAKFAYETLISHPILALKTDALFAYLREMNWFKKEIKYRQDPLSVYNFKSVKETKGRCDIIGQWSKINNGRTPPSEGLDPRLTPMGNWFRKLIIKTDYNTLMISQDFEAVRGLKWWDKLVGKKVARR